MLCVSLVVVSFWFLHAFLGCEVFFVAEVSYTIPRQRSEGEGVVGGKWSSPRSNACSYSWEFERKKRAWVEGHAGILYFVGAGLYCCCTAVGSALSELRGRRAGPSSLLFVFGFCCK